VQIWACEMKDGRPRSRWRPLPRTGSASGRSGGAAVKIILPGGRQRRGVDFYFVMNAPSFTDGEEIWDAYQEGSRPRSQLTEPGGFLSRP
jgi:hypothetical protein